MRSPTLKILVLLAATVSTCVTAHLLWKSWEMVTTPMPSAESYAFGTVPHPASVPKPGETAVVVREPASPVVALDEVYVSLGLESKKSRSLVLNLELELFDERGRETVDRFRSAVRDLVLQSAMEQPYASLRTLPGKLSFKEVLVARINTLVNQPVVRNVHFASFYLQ